MSRICEITGRGPRITHQVSHAHNVSKHWVYINLQTVRVLVNGRVQKMRVSTKAIKSGLIVKPPFKIRERKPKVVETRVVEAPVSPVMEEAPREFFSQSSVVSLLFKPKKLVAEDGSEEAAEGAEGEAEASPAKTDIAPTEPQA